MKAPTEGKSKGPARDNEQSEGSKHRWFKLLHSATLSKVFNVGKIEALLAAGADAKVKNKDGKTPWNLAQENDGLRGTKGYWALNDAQYN